MKKSCVFMFLFLFTYSALADDAVKVWPEKAQCSARISYIDLTNNKHLTEELDQHISLKRETDWSKDTSGQVVLRSKKSNLVIELRPSFKNYELDGNPAKTKNGYAIITGLFGENVFTSAVIMQKASHTELGLNASLNFLNPAVEQVRRAYFALPETERKKPVSETYKKAFPDTKTLMLDVFAGCNFYSFDTEPVDPGL